MSVRHARSTLPHRPPDERGRAPSEEDAGLPIDGSHPRCGPSNGLAQSANVWRHALNANTTTCGATVVPMFAAASRPTETKCPGLSAHPGRPARTVHGTSGRLASLRKDRACSPAPPTGLPACRAQDARPKPLRRAMGGGFRTPALLKPTDRARKNPVTPRQILLTPLGWWRARAERR